ncbi:hypothetical protein ACUY3K_03625 [Corynebacterium uberis]|uniref:hypothetical protein n=1 Tax=Corynebacterium TaxID=1716 RepID=UPI001D0B4502|nr:MULTISPECIES: hypothetical protein [Corynebacterium]MCZ9309318.1 hypothetical protein [Corynebacterium sp. c6VSa_13]UDL72869.1 hypothetical protein LH391_07035 [Corynebacterium uberis]UDL76254.1 hypothetical protein LH393_02360 [Corynebacterium uberis]UDL78466.1 hypothetical protein LH394_02350 [Corynebacterium uberis]UDL80749.1 hypothetical protein LH392_02780 [Corynebacterium uberis]
MPDTPTESRIEGRACLLAICVMQLFYVETPWLRVFDVVVGSIMAVLIARELWRRRQHSEHTQRQ